MLIMSYLISVVYLHKTEHNYTKMVSVVTDKLV